MQLDDWNDLKFVLAAHREGTLTGAAKALRVDQTTVSRRLKALQERAGFPLYERLRGGILWTPAGEAFVAAAAEMERKLHDLERHTLGEEPALSGSLRITLPEVLAASWIEVFADFSAEYPGIELTVVADDHILNITRREADIAIRYTANPPEHLVGRKVARMALAPYVGANVPVGTQLPWGHWDEGTIASRTVGAWIDKHDPDSTNLFRVDSFFVLVEAVRAGRVRAVLPCGCADLDPRMRRDGDPDPAFTSDLWLLTHENLRRVPRVRALLDHLGAWFEANQALMEGLSGKPA